jgi:hypothetical protein
LIIYRKYFSFIKNYSVFPDKLLALPDFEWIKYKGNRERTLQDRNMNGRTPYQAFPDGAREEDQDQKSAG